MRLRYRRALVWTGLTNGVLAAGALLYLASQVHSAQDLVLVRNALIADVGPVGAYNWTPSSVPDDYRVETLPAPDSLQQFADLAAGASKSQSDFELALSLARELGRNRVKGRGPIQSDTVTALARITREGAGYCADYTQVFNALGRAAGLFVREWGMAFDGYGGDGHAFSEVWDRSRQKWIAIDTFFSLYFVNGAGEPLSVIEVREALLQEPPHDIAVVRINPEKFGFKTGDHALKYYRRGAPRMFMIWGNDVLSYDQATAVKLFSRISRSAEQVAGIVTGVDPDLLIPLDLVDTTALDELARLRFIMALLAGTLLLSIAALALALALRK